MSIVYFLALNYFLLLIFTLGRKRRGKLDVSQSEFVQVARLTLLRTTDSCISARGEQLREHREHESQDLRTLTRTHTVAHHALTADAQTDCDSRLCQNQCCSGRVEGVWLSAVVCHSHSFLDRRSISTWSARCWSRIHEILARPTPTDSLTSLRILTTTDTNFNIHINLTVFGGWFWLALLYNWNRGSGQIYLECSQSGRR